MTSQPDKQLNSVSQSQAEEITQHVADVYTSGLPLSEGLRAVASELPTWGLLGTSARTRRALKRIAHRVEHGEAIEDILSSLPVRNELKAVMTSGINSNVTAEAVGEYTSYVRGVSQTRSYILSSLAYPVLVTGLTLSLMIAFLIWFVPTFQNILDDFGMEIPAPTRILFLLGDFFARFGPIAVGIPIAAALLFMSFLAWGGVSADRVMGYVPVIGRSFHHAAMARFSHVLAVVLRHEAPVEGALHAAGAASRRKEIRRACEELSHRAVAGDVLPESHPALSEFPLSFLRIAQQDSNRNTLAAALHAIGDSFAHQSRGVAVLMGLVQPLLLIVLSAAVGFVMIAMIFPLFRLMGSFL